MAIREISAEEILQDLQQLAEFNQLAEGHRDETEKELADITKVDFEAYKILQASGGLIALGAFTDDNKLVGYACAFLSHSFHYGYLVATNDSIYVKPDYRSGGYGLRLMREVERISKEKGAKFMFWQAKIDSPLNKILLRRGCKAEETVYLKEL